MKIANWFKLRSFAADKPDIYTHHLIPQHTQPNQLLVDIALDKTDIGKARKGFDFLGKRILPTGIHPSATALSCWQQKTVRLESQGASKQRIGQYWRRWLGWAGVGLCLMPFTPSALASHGLTYATPDNDSSLFVSFKHVNNVDSSVNPYGLFTVSFEGCNVSLFGACGSGAPECPAPLPSGGSSTSSSIIASPTLIPSIAFSDPGVDLIDSTSNWCLVKDGHGSIWALDHKTLRFATANAATTIIPCASTDYFDAFNGCSSTLLPVPQTITFADPMDQTYAPGATFNAPASSDSGLTVTVTSNTLGVCTVVGNTVSIVAAGDCDLTASRAGNGNYNAAVDVDQTVVIAKADQVISFAALPPKTFGDPAFMVNATGGDSGNAVTFTAMGSCTISGNTVTLTNGGNCTITSAQAGNANYNAAIDVDQSFNIGDNDDIPDAIEDAAPNDGDGNNDGIPDSEQTQVSSLINITGDYITMAVSGGCAEIQNPEAVNPPAPDQIYTYPLGLLSFRLPCETATVKVYYHGTAELNNHNYRKYGPLPPNFDVPQWYVFADTVFANETIDGNLTATATFDLADAQLGDDTGDDGFIVEPGGPGLPSTEPIPTLNQWALLGLAILLGLIGMGQIRRVRIK